MSAHIQPAVVGEVFGRGWKAQCSSWQRQDGVTMVTVSCPDCGELFDRPLTDMRQRPSNACRSCSRQYLRSDAVELPLGAQFGLWTVIGERLVGGKIPVRCECGVEKLVHVKHLVHGRSRGCKACGYLNVAAANTKHGESDTALYDRWHGIKVRCETPTATSYDSYGGRGITMYAPWSAYYTVFRDWALANGWHKDLSIDRIDPDGNYVPDNCRWIPRSDNSKRARRGSSRGKPVAT